MKMVIAGAWVWDIYQQACADALNSLGVNVIRFDWSEEFTDSIGKIEAHTLIPIVKIPRLRKNLLNCCLEERPDYLLVWGCSWLDTATLDKLKDHEVKLISYHNDDPFGNPNKEYRYILQRNIWRNFIKCLPSFDFNFVYRNKNIDDYKGLGLNETHLLPSYYIPSKNFPMDIPDEQLFDGVFIGHYENDERAEFISRARKAGIVIETHGTLWDSCSGYGNEFKNLKPLYGPAYNRKICEAKFALCFFSNINNDDYTRRVFEITAAGTVLISPRTEMMESLFVDGHEAIFFESIDDGILKIKALLSRPDEIRRISKNGIIRAKEYSVEKRMEFLLETIGRI